MNNRILAVFLCLALVSLSGCWDLQIIEELAMISGMGIDTVQGKPDILQITTVNPAFSEESTSPNARRTVQGYSVTQALMNMQLQRQRTLILNKLRVLAFSEDAAKTSTMHNALRELDQRRDMDPSAWVVIVQGDTAQALFNMEPPEESRPSIYLGNILKSATANGRIPGITVHHYWRQYNTRGIQPVIPILELNEAKDGVVIRGLAVINEQGKMAGKLSDTEMLYYMLMTGNMQRGRFYAKVDYVRQRNRQISALIKGKKTTIKTKIENDKPVVDIKLELQIDSLDIDMTFETHLEEDIFMGLETSLAQVFQGELVKVIQKTQDYESDIFSVGEQVRIQHPQWFRGKDWAKVYKECTINAEVKVVIKRIGTLVNPRY